MKVFGKRTLLLTGICLLVNIATAQKGREIKNIDFDWYFRLGDVVNAHHVNYVHSGWRKLDLPHDWSIEGEYSKSNPAQGAFLPGGIGWYRRVLQWNKNLKDRKVSIEFDGVFMNSEVWINGHRLGKRPNGFIGFHYDLSPFLKKGENIIAVRVDNSRLPSARWYTGSGIYRHVNIVTTNKIHVARHGTYVQTPEVTTNKAVVSVETVIENESGKKVDASIISIISDKNGNEVARRNRNVVLGTHPSSLIQKFSVQKPLLWSPSSPDMYSLTTIIKNGNNLVDTYKTPFGIRKIESGQSLGLSLMESV